MNPPIYSRLPIAADILIWAVIVHMVVDWLLQTNWMAENKTNLHHPAAYVHSGMHAIGLLLVFPWFLALGVGISHLIIDTRRPITWWIDKVKQMPKSTPVYMHVEIWIDQIFHVGMLVIAVLLLPYLLT
jgi:Protein of unknown function (DUF3307)